MITSRGLWRDRGNTANQCTQPAYPYSQLHCRYEEALKAAEANEAQLKEHKLVDIGEKYIEHLLANGDVKTAAELCPKILKRDAKRWEQWIYTFGKLKQYKAIVDHIPTANPVLQATVYEMVLGHFLNSSDPADHEKFKSLIAEWPTSLYNIANITTALKKKIKTFSTDALMDALAKL
jgi:hypothetical protein